MNYQAIVILIATGFLSELHSWAELSSPGCTDAASLSRAGASAGSQASSFADLKWWEVFEDEQLQELVRKAL